jgi:hypothetical protein
MINFYNQVPSVYPNASRDFQYLSWLINIVLNNVKHNVDDLYTLPNVNIDSKTTELLALTLGFKVKRNYDQKQLTALVGVLPSILKYKGTIRAVEMAADALIMASGSTGDPSCKVHGAQLEVTLPKDLIDITLFLDLLDYILPAGMTCRVIRGTQNKRSLDAIEVQYSDKLRKGVYDDLHIDYDTGLFTGLSGLLELGELKTGETDASGNKKPAAATRPYNTANLIVGHDDSNNETLTLNAGLLDNTIIPVIPTTSVPSDDTQSRAIALYSTQANGEHRLLLDKNNRKLLALDMSES